MSMAFYASASIAVLSTGLAITRTNAVHALLYLIVSFLAVAMIFLIVGAPFVAALEVIIYAGAIMVLFIFVVMMLDKEWKIEHQILKGFPTGAWIGPVILSAILFSELWYLFTVSDSHVSLLVPVGPKSVGTTLLSTYVIGVELASMLLLPGLIGAYYLGRRVEKGSDT